MTVGSIECVGNNILRTMYDQVVMIVLSPASLIKYKNLLEVILCVRLDFKSNFEFA